MMKKLFNVNIKMALCAGRPSRPGFTPLRGFTFASSDNEITQKGDGSIFVKLYEFIAVSCEVKEPEKIGLTDNERCGVHVGMESKPFRFL